MGSCQRYGQQAKQDQNGPAERGDGQDSHGILLEDSSQPHKRLFGLRGRAAKASGQTMRPSLPLALGKG